MASISFMIRQLYPCRMILMNPLVRNLGGCRLGMDEWKLHQTGHRSYPIRSLITIPTAVLCLGVSSYSLFAQVYTYYVCDFESSFLNSNLMCTSYVVCYVLISETVSLTTYTYTHTHTHTHTHIYIYIYIYIYRERDRESLQLPSKTF